MRHCTHSNTTMRHNSPHPRWACCNPQNLAHSWCVCMVGACGVTPRHDRKAVQMQRHLRLGRGVGSTAQGWGTVHGMASERTIMASKTEHAAATLVPHGCVQVLPHDGARFRGFLHTQAVLPSEPHLTRHAHTSAVQHTSPRHWHSRRHAHARTRTHTHARTRIHTHTQHVCRSTYMPENLW